MTSTLSLVDYAALSPLLIVLTGALVMLLLETFANAISDKASSWLAFVFFAAAAAAATAALTCSPAAASRRTPFYGATVPLPKTSLASLLDSTPPP